MIASDLELLRRVAHATETSGQVVLSILGERGLPDPDPVRLRALGKTMSAVGADLLARAAELDGRACAAPSRALAEVRA